MQNGNPDWQRFVRRGDTVFDVGANLGNKTEMFLQQGARVLCVEPQPNCVAALRKRFRWNRKVTVIPKGLAEKPGTLDFSICSEAHTISTFSEQWKTGRFAEYKWDKVIQVPVTTLDALIAAHGVPAYCKVDVEGFELSVLKGLTRPLPLLSFEFSREFIDNARECARYLEGVGFDRFNYAAGEDPHFAAQEWLTVEGLFGQLAQNADPMFWGDIYAQSSQVPAPGSYSRSGFLHEIVRFFRPHDAPK